MTNPKYKVGDNVGGRLITMVIPNGWTIMYGYRYENEPESAKPLFCSQTTLQRYEKEKA